MNCPDCPLFGECADCPWGRLHDRALIDAVSGAVSIDNGNRSDHRLDEDYYTPVPQWTHTLDDPNCACSPDCDVYVEDGVELTELQHYDFEAERRLEMPSHTYRSWARKREDAA